MGGIRIRSIEWIFYFLILFFISASIIYSIPIAEGEIGISSNSLMIRTSKFYIGNNI